MKYIQNNTEIVSEDLDSFDSVIDLIDEGMTTMQNIESKIASNFSVLNDDYICKNPFILFNFILLTNFIS